MTGFPCPCCGFLTRSDSSPGSFEVCPVCYWEDDNVQFNNADFKGGANEEILNEARQNFKEFGASSYKFKNTVRPPIKEEIPR